MWVNIQRLTGVAHCANVVWPDLEYDFVVQPGADPNQIALDIGAGLVPARGGRTRGAPTRGREWRSCGQHQRQRSRLSQASNLSTGNGLGQRTRDIVEGKYVIRAGQQVTFDIASYDKTRPLVIDPTLVYSSYLGGSGEDFGTGITVDAAGNAYLIGFAESADFPTTTGRLSDHFRRGGRCLRSEGCGSHFCWDAGEAELSRQECLCAGPALWRPRCSCLSPRVPQCAGTAGRHPGVLRGIEFELSRGRGGSTTGIHGNLPRIDFGGFQDNVERIGL